MFFMIFCNGSIVNNTVSYRATIFQGRLSFSTLVFLERLCFEVDYLSRATMYCVITVFIETDLKFIQVLLHYFSVEVTLSKFTKRI